VKRLLLALLVAAGAGAQTTPVLSYYIHDTHGIVPDTPLPATYKFADTLQGSGTPVVIKAINISGGKLYLAIAFVSGLATSDVLSTNFTVTGLFIDLVMPAGTSVIFTVNFTPSTIGPLTGFLRAAYQVQQPNCDFTDPTNSCPSFLTPISTLTGNAIAPKLVLSCPQCPVPYTPNASSPLSFGNSSTSSTTAITFTLTNPTSAAQPAPAISLITSVYFTSPFLVDSSTLPASIAANSAATFTVTFAPGQTGTALSTLVVGSNSYPIVGVGIIVADVDALDIYYVDATQVKGFPQGATPIPFGQLLAGVTSTLVFNVTNSPNSWDSVTAAVTVTGAGFSLSGAPVNPVTFPPGQDVTFSVVFTPSITGVVAGTLSIGARQFALSGQGIASPLPAIALQIAPSPLASQEQANLTVQLASASTISAIGSVGMTFTPSVANAAADPAIVFTATNGPQLALNVAVGAQSATYNNQANLTFQTGTTAGELAFTVNFVNTSPYLQSFSIPATAVKVTSSSAVRQSPDLVVTLSGYDNTYTAGALSFTFYDLSGNIIQAPITYDATAAFHSYFFTKNQYGGSFAMQANFPINGDITQIGSVAVGMTNSIGQTATTVTVAALATTN
jgi:hypothetical protein